VEREVQEGLAGGDGGPQLRALGFVPALLVHGQGRFARFQGIDTNAEHLQRRARNLGEVAVLVLFPVPVRSQLGQAAEARLALAQFGGALGRPVRAPSL
jgi:hypothetical protein